jgi:hypothetical protein
MAKITKPYTVTNGQTADATQFNSNMDTIYNDYNGNITNANLAAGAAIVGSKLDLSSPGTIGGTVASPGTFTNLTASTATCGTISITTDIYTVAWTDYSATSTIVGWSSYTTKQIYYKKIGKTVFVSYYLGGASNSTATSFTLPDNSAASPTSVYHSLAFTYDNSDYVNPSGVGGLGASSNSVVLYKENAASAGNWTDSNDKIVIGQFFYETA